MGTMILVILVVLLLFLGAFLLMRTLAFSRPEKPAESIKQAPIDTRTVAINLASAIRCKTVSNDDSTEERVVALDELHRMLEQTYPAVHAHLSRQIISEHSLVYIWGGKNPDLAPILLMAHQDVVPADPSTLEEWTHPPFDGVIDDGFVWGRGAIDIKGQLIAILEAVESLLKTGYQPERTIYLAFGHDEEIGGLQGARQVAAWLQEKGEHFEAVLDEGPAIQQGILPGIEAPTALIATAEKGYLTLKLSVEAKPGHSSTPPRQTAIGILGAALAKLEANPMSAHPERLKPLYQAVGGAAPFTHQLTYANLWLLKGIARRLLAAHPQTDAMIRTTTAPTIIAGGVKDNILPHEAHATVNFRLLPGDKLEDVYQHIYRTINDSRVTLDIEHAIAWEASPDSPIDAPAFQTLKQTIQQIFGPVPASPHLMLGATDARHYVPVCDQIYRFSPLTLTNEDASRIHGIDERISVEDLAQMVRFFVQLIKNWAGEEN